MFFVYPLIMKRQWNEEEISKLKELSEKHTMRELANIFDRTVDSIRDKIRKLNLKSRGLQKRSDDDIKNIVRTIDRFGIAHVAATSNLSKDTLSGIYRRHQSNEQKRLASFSKKRLEALRQKAFSHALYKGQRHEQAEEFASYLMLKFVENGGRFIRVDWTYSTWLMDYIGVKYDHKNNLTDSSKTQLNLNSAYAKDVYKRQIQC